ncbi:MAG: hypothetical protein Q9187_002346 [Circinaria calcarea]
MKLSIVALVLGIALVDAQVAQYCVEEENNVCYRVNVPPQSASSGQGDIYFQIQGPSSKQWIGLGQGSQMRGANIFIIYSDPSGQNVTLSPRLGEGNFMPLYNSEAQVSLLDGTGIANGTMTANVRCSNCSTWSGGSMDFSDPESQWIFAVRDGSPISSSDVTANLQQHTIRNGFTLDLTRAVGGNSLNPFTSTGVGGSVPISNSSSNGTAASSESSDTANLAHGIIMSLAFLIFFPFGALTLFAYSLALAGFGVGIWIAVTSAQLRMAHPIIGIVVISLLFFQPILGLVHHMIYRRTHSRTLWARVHIWYGRALMSLGAINGGLGLQLAGDSGRLEIAYGVVAGVVFSVYVFVTILGTYKSRDKLEGETGATVLKTGEIGMVPLGAKGSETEALNSEGGMNGTSGR